MGKPSFHVRSAVIFLLVAALFMVPALAWGDELPEETLADNSTNALAEAEQADDEVALLMDSVNQKEKEAAPVVDLLESQNDAVSATEEQQGESRAADNADGEDSSLPEPEPVKVGFGQEDGSIVYFKSDGSKAKGWLNLSGSIYYFDTQGHALKGWQSLDGQRYWFDPATGKAAVWNRQIDGDWYYFDGAGRMVTGWVVGNNDGLRLYFDPSTGKRQSGWRDYAGSRYYLSPATGKSVQWNQKIGGDWYYFDGRGRMVTGLVRGGDDGLVRIYDKSTGVRLKGWVSLGGKRYYIDPATEKSVRWNQKIDGKWYYFNGNSEMVTGLVRGGDDGLVRIYDKSTGVRLKGWVSLGGKRYYIDPATEKSVRWNQKIDGKWYYFNGNSEMVTGLVRGGDDGLVRIYDKSTGVRLKGWVSLGGKRYYIDPATEKSVRWNQKIDGKWYYFNGNSEMVTGLVRGGDDGLVRIYDKSTGVRLKGWVSLGGKRYYIDPATEKSVRWNQKIDGKWYYFNGNSEMVTGMVTGNNDGLKLYFDPNTGIRQTGWKTISGHKYYFDPATGKSSRWNRLIDGKWYYFNAASQMVTGWVKKHDENAWLYYWPDGTRASGTQVIGGYRYSFNKDGLTYTKPIIRSQAEQSMINKAQQYSSRTGYLILVNRSTHKVGVFVGSTGAWSLKYYWSCVTGAPATPTIVGSFYTTGSKRGSLSTDSRAKYCTQIKGGYFFHTILASESELGHSLSHGCIRLSYESARWIYSNVKAGTRVIIY